MKKNFIAKYGEEKTNKLRFFIGDVRDKERLYRAFKDVDYCNTCSSYEASSSL